VREQQIRRAADLDVSRAALNDALGLPLDTPHTLSMRLAPLNLPPAPLADYERNALGGRPEARRAKLATSLAGNQAAAAHSNLLPQVNVHAAFEADRQRFYDKGGANWLVSAGLRWNLFNGFSDKAHIAEGRFALRRSEAEQDRAGSAIRLQVRRAYADLSAAAQRIEVAQASVAEAEESLRITLNRYECGMSNVTDLLRTETAVLEARTRHLTAIRDQRIAAAILELVDFIELRLAEGMPLDAAVIDAGAVRFRPMMLTAAVVVGSSVILFDPIFQGLAIALMACEIASLLLSRMTVPVLFYLFNKGKRKLV